MPMAKLVLAIGIFLLALNLLLLGPDRRQAVLTLVGLHLQPNSAIALSIIGMVFSVILALKTVAAWALGNGGAKHPTKTETKSGRA